MEFIKCQDCKRLLYIIHSDYKREWACAFFEEGFNGYYSIRCIPCAKKEFPKVSAETMLNNFNLQVEHFFISFGTKTS